MTITDPASEVRLAASAASAAGPRFHRSLAQRLLARPQTVASAVVLALMVLLILIGPPVGRSVGIDPAAVDLLGRFQPPSAAHPLGTDEAGRDLLLRLLEGGRVSLAIGVTIALAAAVIGTAIGLFAGYFGGRLDALLMRFTDGVIALPLLPLLIVLAAVDLGKLGLPRGFVESAAGDFWRIAVIISLVGWTTVARLVRGATLSLREREFVRAAQALGARPLRIILVHILPNVMGPLVVATTLSVGNAILLESVLSFLGLGIQPPLASWGGMLTNAQELIWSAPALAVWPGSCIFLTVICCNLLGDGLRDALDPRSGT
jgi:peptide/nickel transport system permease protein